MTTVGLLIFALLPACQNPPGDPTMASAPYPMSLHQAQSVPIQVIRDDDYIEIINSTANDYTNCTLWVNQRYSGSLPPVLAGSTVRFSLWDLRDAYGEQFNAGGVWRTDEPALLVIAELQSGIDAPLLGLVVIGEE